MKRVVGKSKLDSKQRVLNAINHQESDRVPFDYWGTPEVDESLKEHFNVTSRDDLLAKLKTDIRYIYASGIIYEDNTGLFNPTAEYRGSVRGVRKDGCFEDLWGITRKLTTVASGNTYRDVVKSPLRSMNSAKEIESYQYWPKAEDFDFTMLRTECKKKKDYALFLGGMPGCATTFIQCWYLRGLDQIMSDLILAPKLAHAIIDKISQFQLEYTEKMLAEIGDLADVLMLADDYGTQNGLMIGVKHFREFFREPTKRLINLAKKYNMKVLLHSDGNINKLIPEFIGMGVDILNPIQNVGSEMAPDFLKKEFGKDLCFHGAIDTQNVLPNVSTEQVSEEIRNKIDILSKGGGYIVCPTHMIQKDIPQENILAMYSTDRKRS